MINALTEAERNVGWRLLFDGETMDGWRNFRKPDLSPNWTVEDGCMSLAPRGGNIVYDEAFGDFHLVMEWKIGPAGNSGVFYRVSEEIEHAWHTGMEYQILDNFKHKDGEKPETRAGSLYGLYAPSRSVTRPVGEWNEARIIAQGNHVEHWMNSIKLCAFDIGSPDWNARVEGSKFAGKPFGKCPEGLIMLQDHGDPVWYRNVKIMAL